jgi:IMP cyclohydrolase
VTRDGRFYVGLWRTTEPIFQALKDDNPNIITVSRSYREPICFDTRTTSSAGADDQLLSGFTHPAGFIGGDEGGRAATEAL